MKINFLKFMKAYLSFYLLFTSIILICIFVYVNSSLSAYSEYDFSNQHSNQESVHLDSNPLATTAALHSSSEDSTSPSSFNEMTLILEVGNPFMTINGVIMNIDPMASETSPIVEDGRTLIPVSAVVAVIGGSTSWNSDNQSIHVELNKTIIEFTLNKRSALVNGVSKKLDVPPKLFNQRTLVPLRFLVENCNLSIEIINTKIVIVANYLPEGIQEAKRLFQSMIQIQDFSKIPTVLHVLSRKF